MSDLLGSAIIWQPDDYVFFKQCGEVTISPDIQNIGFNCLFCTGVCLQTEIFLQHLQEQHKEEVFKLYEGPNSITLVGQETPLLANNFSVHSVLNSNEISLPPLMTTNNICITGNQIQSEELKDNCINLNIAMPLEDNTPSTIDDRNAVHEMKNNDLITITSTNRDLQNLITLNPCANPSNHITALNNNTAILTSNATTPTFSPPSNCISDSSCVFLCSPNGNEFEIDDGADSGIVLVQSPCHSNCSGLSDCMFTEDSSSKSSHTFDQNLPDPENEQQQQSEPTKCVKGKYFKTPAMREALIDKELITYLLEIYRKNEKLWNPKHPAYKYNAPRTIYSELSELLLNDRKCALAGEEIFGIITELRGRYRRELKKFEIRKGKHKTRLWFFDQMQFLRQIIEEKRNRTDKSKDNCTNFNNADDKLTNRQILSCLLDLYRQNECLWNPKHEDFRGCNKQKLYQKISEQLKENLQIDMTETECLNEIQKVRIRYCKELRTFHKLKGLYTPNLWCFDEMEFLRPALEEKITNNLAKISKCVTHLTNRKYGFQKSSEIKFRNLEQQLKFIEIYRRYNSLWDVDHPDYRSTNYRRKALIDMLEKINTTFEEEKLYELEQVEKTLYLLCKDFSNEKHKHLTKNYLSKSSKMSFVVYEKLNEFLGINVGPFRCDHCQRICKTYDQYKIHKSTHDGTLPFICTLCGKGFQMPGNLTIHLRRHRRDFPYSCEACHKSFATSTEVSIHMRSHTGERPYACESCDKTFKTWSFYDLHKRIHLNQSNFHCPICDKAFYERNRFTDHMNIHLNIRKHQCHQCGKSFTTVGNLKKHMDLHASVKKYKCLPCGKSFAQLASLRWHRKTQHKQATLFHFIYLPYKKTNVACTWAPKYQTAYACEGKKLTIECDPGDLINLIRANYGRFSITICNDHGNMEWSVNCMFPKSLTVLNSRCAHKQSCSVLATTSMFGDPCPGTHKYLEAHYQCISASQTSTTTNRPSPPPWVLSNAPPLLPNGSSSIINPAVLPPPLPPAQRPQMPMPGLANTNLLPNAVPSSPGPPTIHTTLPGGRLKAGYNNTALKTPTRHDGLPPPPPLHHHHHSSAVGHHPSNDQGREGPSRGVTASEQQHNHNKSPVETKTSKAPVSNSSNSTAPPNTRILTGVGGSGSDDDTLLTTKTTARGQQQQPPLPTGTTTASSLGSLNTTLGSGVIKSINNINLNTGLGGEDETNLFCGPINARNLFWNMTRVGDVNVQPCPGGATGIAKWRCVLMKRITLDDDDDSNGATQTPICNGTSCINLRLRNFEPTWHPLTPDLTQCRSLWLNNLEVRVNHRDSSLISIANDLSEVTSSKTLYGGDMLVTTKIIQAMSEKMYHDKETFPDQRLREAMILELLQGVVKTGSNLLDESQLSSWLDLNQEDQMRVATSLLTGLEDNAFLLADTIIRERNVVQKVKNILLSVRVLETKSIQSNEVFPDAEQWQISDDRIELPRAALIENSEGGLVRIVFAAFDRLESILKPSYDHFDLKSARSYIRNTAILANDSDSVNSQQRIRILNSKVISASLGKGRHIQLSQPIKLILRHLKTENVTNPTCVFWNYIDHAWSANGCVLESTNRTHSICMCNHLTNFAILMDVMDVHTHSLFTMFDGNMRILIYVSISICLVFIVIALLTLKIFNGVFIKSARTSIYRNIYICLLLIEVLFLIGIEQIEANIIFCGFTTVFLHCAILTAIAWFCFEAFQSYTTLTTDDILLEVDQTSKVNCYYLLSYALSFTIVAISLAINPSTYTENDYCVLMETNLLFYATFVMPLMIFLMGAFSYTFLSWVIMCRKSRTALKNKEHTRLANVRFDIRCSFIFLLLLCGTWFSAYFYLRRSKIDDEMSQMYGYLFVSLNAMMGIYIFIFHCIQNEKIRREYRKYVRQNSWLPKCLRCSKTSISSGIVGGSACGMNSAGNTGTLNSNTNAIVASTGTQLKKTIIPLGDANENDETGNIITATEDAIMASSDCELNEGSKSRRQGSSSNSSVIGGVNVATGGGAIKGGIMPGNLVLQHANKGNDLNLQGHVVSADRNASALVGGGAGATGTLRSTGGMRTPSAGHTSPTSSVSSTHLIFGQGHKQQQLAAGSMNGVQAPQEALYHQPDYYAWQKANKAATPARDFHGSGVSPQQQQQQSHEFFYWTQKHQQGHGKKKRGSNAGSDSPSGSLHSRNTATSQQILFYPSYKKTPMKQQPPSAQHSYYAEALDPGAPPPPHYQQQRRPHPYQQQQQQLSSDDEQMEHAAHAHLLQQMKRRGPGTGEFVMSQPGTQQRYYRNKHSNCDLNQSDKFDLSRGVSGGGGGETYYNQGSLASDNGPVYEEILSNRTSDVQHYNVDDMLPQHDYEDERAMQAAYQRQQQQQRMLKNRYPHSSGGSGSGGVGLIPSNIHHRPHHDYVDDFEGHEAESPYTDDEDEDEDEEEDEDEPDDEGSDDHLPPQSDERMRRLMAIQDADFQRRFQRQLRKNAQAGDGLAAPPSYNDYHEPQYPVPPQQQQQQLQQPITVFGVSSGAGGSVRSFKKTTNANGSRLAVNELFATTHGPPLPPANQHPMQKKQQMQQQQQQQQQISPQSANNMPVVGRNISAMLDENNTVRCYLEPLEK